MQLLINDNVSSSLCLTDSEINYSIFKQEQAHPHFSQTMVKKWVLWNAGCDWTGLFKRDCFNWVNLHMHTHFFTLVVWSQSHFANLISVKAESIQRLKQKDKRTQQHRAFLLPPLNLISDFNSVLAPTQTLVFRWLLALRQASSSCQSTALLLIWKSTQATFPVKFD